MCDYIILNGKFKGQKCHKKSHCLGYCNIHLKRVKNPLIQAYLCQNDLEFYDLLCRYIGRYKMDIHGVLLKSYIECMDGCNRIIEENDEYFKDIIIMHGVGSWLNFSITVQRYFYEKIFLIHAIDYHLHDLLPQLIFLTLNFEELKAIYKK